MPLLVPTQRTPEWLDARIGRITASTAAAVLGLCPFRSAKAAWREIVNQKTEAEKDEYMKNRSLQFGVAFEAAARLEYEAITGNWVTETGLWVSEKYPFLCASPDGLIGADGLAEVKAPEYARPLACHYRIQCLVQLIVTDRQWCDFASFGWRDNSILIQRVQRLSPTGERALVGRLEEWYDIYVRAGCEPPRKKARKK